MARALAPANRVVLLDKGRIIEEGTPAELLARNGRFAAFLELEARLGLAHRA